MKQTGLTIARRDFEAVKGRVRFARRPYGCLFLVRPGYFVQEDLAAALAGLGVRVTPVAVAPDEGKAAFLERLLVAILTHRPDFVLTLSHTGVDAEGTLIGLLGELRLPLASWLLDSPDLLLAGHPELAADHVAIFSCDAGALPAITAMGYRHVAYLPLAAAADRLDGPGDRPSTPATGVCFLGEDFLAETGRRLRAGRFGRDLLGLYKRLAERLRQRPCREMWRLFGAGEDQALARYQALSPEGRRDFDLTVLCRATTRTRATVLAGVLPFAPLVVGPATWKTTMRPHAGWTWHPPVRDPAAVAALFRDAAVNLNITSAHMHGAANQRLFEVPAAGGFLLTDAGPQVEALFEPGREVATYAGPEAVGEACARYLADAPARAAMIRAARRRIRHEHTYGHRAAAMLQALKAMVRSAEGGPADLP